MWAKSCSRPRLSACNKRNKCLGSKFERNFRAANRLLIDFTVNFAPALSNGIIFPFWPRKAANFKATLFLSLFLTLALSSSLAVGMGLEWFQWNQIKLIIRPPRQVAVIVSRLGRKRAAIFRPFLLLTEPTTASTTASPLISQILDFKIPKTGFGDESKKSLPSSGWRGLASDYQTLTGKLQLLEWLSLLRDPKAFQNSIWNSDSELNLKKTANPFFIEH